MDIQNSRSCMDIHDSIKKKIIIIDIHNWIVGVNI